MDKATLEALFDRAVQNLKNASIISGLAQGKAFELYALLVLLRRLRAVGFSVVARNCAGGVLRFPGAPAIPDKLKFSFFDVVDSKGEIVYEVWQSLEVVTLSCHLSGSGPAEHCSYHEVDVGVFRAPLASGVRPNFEELVFAASCKYRPITKEHVREALGLRRETGLLDSETLSSAPWFRSTVPSRPPVPVVLFSKDPAAPSYAEPVSRLGLYVRRLAMP